MDALYQRGVRHFKFVDRTFNLKIDASIRIMEFFLARMDEHLFLHFELSGTQKSNGISSYLFSKDI